MNDQYTQVVMSYAHRVRSWGRIGYLIVGGIAAFVVFLLAIGGATQGEYEVPLLVDAALFSLIAVHVRDQFSSPQARLIPNFRKAHGVVAVAALLIVAVFVPTFFTLLAGCRSVGFIAIAICCCGVMLWSVLLQMNWGFSALWIILFVTVRPTRELMDLLTSGQAEIGAVTLLMLGILIALPAGFRLLSLNEESLGYGCKKQTDGVAKCETSVRGDPEDSLPQNRFSFWLIDRQTVRLIRHARRAATSQWSRVCRWQAGMSTFWSALFLPIGMILAFSISDRLSGTGNGGSYWEIFVLFTLLTPVTSWQGVYFKSARAAATSRELLMPVSRSTYLKELGLAAAISQFQAWGAISVAATLWWFVGLQSQIPVASLVSILLITALSQFWLFGLVVLLPLQPGSIKAVLGVGFAAIVPLLVAWAVARPISEWQYGLIALSAVLAILGLLATWIGYRRWLVTDLD